MPILDETIRSRREFGEFASVFQGRIVPLQGDQFTARITRPSRPPLLDAGRATMAHANHPHHHRHRQGPAEWFTGDVYIDMVEVPAGTSTFAAASVHFTPGARTAWHTHPHGQTIYVTEGVGVCQCEGGPIEVIRPGARVFFEPSEYHWHGAAPDRFMVHTAMQQNDESGSPVAWRRQVTDEEYAAAPSGDG